MINKTLLKNPNVYKKSNISLKNTKNTNIDFKNNYLNKHHTILQKLYKLYSI